MNTILVISGVLVLLNCLVTAYVIRNNDFDGKQKFLQCTVVWLIPLLGAVLIYLVARSLSDASAESKGEFGGGPQDSGWANPTSGEGS